MDYITNSPDETRRLASKIASELHGGETLCLYGDLGAGKTTYASGIINFFLSKKRVLSPTFIIVRHYQTDDPLIKDIYHIDLYRISKEEEMQSVGLVDFINNPKSIVIIEWAEKLKKFLPGERMDIHFSTIDNNKRIIEITKIWKT